MRYTLRPVNFRGLFQYADCIFHEDKLSYPRSVKAIMGIKEGPYWITTHPSGRKEGEKQATIYQMKNAEFFFCIICG